MNKTIFNYWSLKLNKNKNNLKQLCINFGPQHPAAHGVLRMILQLRGEIITQLDPHIGFLHRGTEKLIEQKTYIQALPYFDRLDYVSTLMQEHTFCLGIENLLNLNQQNSLLQTTRTIFDELTRILNHLLAVSCHALDVGSMSSIFWAFEEREKIMEFYERIAGARMHTAYYRPQFLLRKISKNLSLDIWDFTLNFHKFLNELSNTLTQNNIWKIRLMGVGTLNTNDVLTWGLTGVMGRSVGILNDLRLNNLSSYNIYKYLPIKSFFGKHGDSFDRYNLRIAELFESTKLVNISLNNHKKWINPNLIKKLTKTNIFSMENTISHFKYWTTGLYLPKGLYYSATESPKGEFGVYLITDGSKKPLRCKIRSPSYHHLQLFKYLGKGILLADLITLIGTVDIVFGEIDR